MANKITNKQASHNKFTTSPTEADKPNHNFAFLSDITKKNITNALHLHDMVSIQALQYPRQDISICANVGVSDIAAPPDIIARTCAIKICTELHNRYMDLIYQISKPMNCRLDMSDSAEVNLHKLWLGVRHVALNSRNCAGNRMILPYETYCQLLPTLIQSGFKQCTEKREFSDLILCGTIYDIDIYASTRNTVVLMGYKGDDVKQNAGIIHNPGNIDIRADGMSISMCYYYGQQVAANASDYYVNMQVR